jgi:hypothetical protein
MSMRAASSGTVGSRRVEGRLQFLCAPRDVDEPPGVAEVPLQLAQDGRRGVRRELEATLGIEAVDGLDEPDRADLDEVVHGLVAAGEPTREVDDQRHVLLDETIAQLLAGGRVLRHGMQLSEHFRGSGAVR